MPGFLSLIFHAHLPFVRHPEHERFLEENWLFEAITETYLPLIQLLEGWERDNVTAPITLSLSPTLCAMLLDPLLQARYSLYLDRLVELAEKEIYRTHWSKEENRLAREYLGQFEAARATYRSRPHLVEAFRQLQERGRIEIITTAATHAVLPLLADHGPSMRAQILTARDHYQSCFGRPPKGIWLPECAYAESVEPLLQEAGIRWFVSESHGVLYARPQPRYGCLAPIYTPNGIAAFGRDMESARQVWSRHEGYPGDPTYRDFYRDIGFDLDLDYVRPYLPAPPERSFTGIKYHRITGDTPHKRIYDSFEGAARAAEHAEHFLRERTSQIEQAAAVMDRPPLIVCPYDAELFGHWWHEGPRFLDALARKSAHRSETPEWTTPTAFLERFTTHQVCQPSPSSWGEEGYWKVWLNESNEWIYRHIHIAQERMTELARRFQNAEGEIARAVRQAGRELLLAQSSDWPFILRTGTSPEYARRRVQDHLLRFIALHEQLTSTRIDEPWLEEIEAIDNLFPELDFSYWA